MRPVAAILISALGAALLLLSACASGNRGERFEPHSLPLSRGLVGVGVGANSQLFTERSWESWRNDHLMGGPDSDGLIDVRLVEVRTHDHRWTINGRPRESSRTTTRTIQRGVLLSD